MNGKRALFLTILVVTALALPALGCNRASQASFPSKPIELVVHGGPGGGSDIFARTIADVIQKNKLLPVAISVVNKPGGGSAVAKAYFAEKAGDPHGWMTVSNNFHTTHIQGNSPYSYKDFTPLIAFAEDTYVIAVRSDSRFQTMKELMDFAKDNPEKMKWGGGSIGADDYNLMHLLQQATGVKFNFVSFESTGEAITQLLGGHVDMVSSNPQEIAGQVEAKTVRLLAVGGGKRIASQPNLPTLKEMGYDVVHRQTRGLVAPKGTTEDVLKYTDEMFKKMAATADWQKYIKDNDLIEKFEDHTQFAKTMAEEYEIMDKIYESIGLKKK